jgi:hypothetical protein
MPWAAPPLGKEKTTANAAANRTKWVTHASPLAAEYTHGPKPRQSRNAYFLLRCVYGSESAARRVDVAGKFHLGLPWNGSKWRKSGDYL